MRRASVQHHGVGHAPDGHALQGPCGLHVDHGQVVRQAVDHIQAGFVLAQGQAPGAPAYQHALGDLAAGHIDEGHVVGPPHGHIGAFSVAADQQAHRGDVAGAGPFRSSVRVWTTFCSAVEMMLMLAPSSLLTRSSLPSGLRAMRRGRWPTARVLTSLWLAVSITCTLLATSEVTYTVLPSADTFTPSGSRPTGTLPTSLRLAASMMLSAASSSLDT